MTIPPEVANADQIGKFHIGDRVTIVDGWKAGDVWRIDRLYPGDPAAPETWNRYPSAGLRLVSRAGGLPLGTTATCVALSRVRPVGRPRSAPAPHGFIDPAVMREIVAGWVEGGRANHEALGHSGEPRPCWEEFDPQDIERMIDDAVRETARRQAVKS